MNVCVFLGPTLPAAEAAPILDAVYLPPAAQGDVFLAVEHGARIIGIVDGYFQGAPSVWHKEIMWALSRGVHVLGSSSIGALRAAELEAFGMQGVGRVFEAVRDGVITDDDEVAVLHGPEEINYYPATVALVNIRATLSKALEARVVTEDAHRVMVAIARALPYWERTYEAVLGASADTVGPEVAARLGGWIGDHAIDQKREDAIELLRRIGGIRRGPPRAGFQFQPTDAWHNLVEETRARCSDPPVDPLPDDAGRVLDELRLEPERYREVVAPSANDEPAHAVMERFARSEHFDRLSRRALDKHRTLVDRFGGLPEFADALLAPADVLEWYFERHRGIAVPLDLDDHARTCGLDGTGALCRLLLHELLYRVAAESDHRDGVPS